MPACPGCDDAVRRELSADLRLASEQCQVWGLNSNALVDPETNAGEFNGFSLREFQM